MECSKGLERCLMQGSGKLSVRYARDLFDIDVECCDAFLDVWVAAVKGSASVLRLSLAGAAEQQFVFTPVFNKSGLVTEIVSGAVRTAPAEIEQDLPVESASAIKGTLGKITEMKELFQDIARANKQLERALNSAKNQIELAKTESEAKTEFLANMSHEIRTPMNAVIGFCDLLSNTDLKREQEEYVDAINQSGQLLIKLIGQVLDYSKIESGCLDLELDEICFEQLLLEIRAIMSARLGDKEIEFNLDAEKVARMPLYGDETRIKQILLNLLSNAFKFTRRGRVSLTVESSPSSFAGHVCVRCRVEDTGIGIDPSLVENLFQPFAQANSKVAREFGGSGLGLAICKRLCSAMRGDVWVERTALGEGSVFVFEIHLPVIESNLDSLNPTKSQADMEIEEQQPREESASGDSPPLRLLVVDDNPNNLLITSKLSQYLGYEAETVRNGIEALSKLKEDPFDIVLMDVRMAPINGIETTRKIRDGEAGEQCASAYIIAVTAHALQGDRERCLESGMNDYLSKPLTLERLEESLNRARNELSLD